ncbi:D-alanyl-D-alanine carboxypeptidase [Modicisalibacter ilicicola DSM 19980]|uniref:D-alanyl-D-alanine carboxypeptidase n=1 Tax=Modicisalibacter ilicicola DSM 19980 TaxID=1121942 RepID=A0A1M5A0H1_9GAMM|nr:D-alanyl-D-alanine carboxypeptidase [Halomonas ilicicola]SHF23711.1 D-alanyl-D-alanine carboxypeptidase [Halomonas ilicicola DSM 19980]
MASTRSSILSRRLGTFLSIWFIGLALSIPLQAQAEPNPRYASIVIDTESGEILLASNADAPRYPASLTKMMTLYLLFEALEDRSLTMDDTLPVSSRAAAQPPSKLWVRPGDRISVEEAILALIVRSANDVAVVVAEGLAGSERAFAIQMTDKARALGMDSTVFRNASGLPDDRQVTTARDMARLSLSLMQDFPQYYDYFSRSRFVYRGKTHTGHNNLLDSYAGADGLKTGYIRASGFNVATSAVRDDHRLVTVVMGGFTAKSRDSHTAKLLDHGFVRAGLLTRSDWIASADVFDSTRAISPAAPRERRLAARPADVGLDASASAVGSAGNVGDDPIQRMIAQVDRARVGREERRPEDVWAIQVGAFRDPHGARTLVDEAVRRLETDLRDSQVSVTPSTSDKGVFRAQLIDMEEGQARRSCAQLKRQGMECVVVRADVEGMMATSASAP